MKQEIKGKHFLVKTTELMGYCSNDQKEIDFRLYLITDRKLITHYSSLVEAVEEALKAGVKAVQLREKDLSTRELLKMAYEMREITSKYNAKLFINDRLDIALCVKADGIHLGQSSMPIDAVKKVIHASGIEQGLGFLIGVSTHSPEEALEAEKEGADFITYGPIYPTPSKLRYGEPVGVESLKAVRGKIRIPIFGIGGIKVENIKEVMDAGAYGVAVISGILGAKNIKNAVKEYLRVVG